MGTGARRLRADRPPIPLHRRRARVACVRLPAPANHRALSERAPGVWAGKKGVESELAVVEQARTVGQFAILHDLTNCLRIGDVTVFASDGDFETIEVKSDPGRRSPKQNRRIKTARAAVRDGGPLSTSDHRARLYDLNVQFKHCMPHRFAVSACQTVRSLRALVDNVGGVDSPRGSAVCRAGLGRRYRRAGQAVACTVASGRWSGRWCGWGVGSRSDCGRPGAPRRPAGACGVGAPSSGRGRADRGDRPDNGWYRSGCSDHSPRRAGARLCRA